MTRVTHPHRVELTILDGLENGRQDSAHFIRAKSENQCDAARLTGIVSAEEFEKGQHFNRSCARSDLDADGISETAEILEVGAV